MRPVGLRCEYQQGPLALATAAPRFSWELEPAAGASSAAAVPPGAATLATQVAYRIRAASVPDLLEGDGADLWDSGWVRSAMTWGVVWQGQPLGPLQRCYWRVSLEDDGGELGHSDPAVFETGMLDAAWQADWIAAPDELLSPLPDSETAFAGTTWAWADDRERPAWLRAAFVVDATTFAAVSRGAGAASVLIGVLGPFDLFLNGRVVDTGTYWRTAAFADLQPLLRQGRNVLAMRVPRSSVGPAGVLARLLLAPASGASGILRSIDLAASWQVIQEPPPDDAWLLPDGPGVDWPTARPLGSYGELPWGGFRLVQPPSEPPLLAHDFDLADRPLEAARLYIAALGLYQVRLNGELATADRLAPGWTDYRQRVLYQAHDVTGLLNPGTNALRVQLADGWYAGNVACVGRSVYGGAPRLIAELHLAYRDGSRQVVASDRRWRAGLGPVRAADLIKGERFDERRLTPSWTAAAAKGAASTGPRLCASRAAPVRVLQEIEPRSIEARPAKDGSHGPRWLVDFGQNLSGHVRLRRPHGGGPADDALHLRLRHAERLDDDGELYTENLRGATQLDGYTLSAVGAVDPVADWLEPGFTTHGFRHLELSGHPGPLEAGDVRACEVSSVLRRSGRFACSDATLQRIYQAILWTQRSNYGALPTDCPNRDERMGWLDVHALAPTAMFNDDLAAYYEAWLDAMREAQYPDGSIPHVVPDVLEGGGGEAGWADCCVILPWLVYRQYGDERVLSDNYDMMRRWLAFLDRESPDRVRPAEGFGDWLAIGEQTPKDLIATAYYARSADLISRVAEVLGRTQEAEGYRQLFADVRQAFQRAYLRVDAGAPGADADGSDTDLHGSDTGDAIRLGDDTQTGYVLALAFDLLPETLRPAAAARLAALIQQRGTLATGYMGMPKLLEVLSEWGYHGLACDLARSEDFPSWGYMLANGATTLWERWDSYRPGMQPGDPAMNSYNHPSLCAIGHWFVRHVAGLAELEPGYRRVIVQPQVGGGIEHAEATYHGMPGSFRVAWRLDNGLLSLALTVPPGCEAEVRLPPGFGQASLGAQPVATAFKLGGGDHAVTAFAPPFAEGPAGAEAVATGGKA